MDIKKEIYNSLQNLNTDLNNILKYSNTYQDEKVLESFLYLLEKRRFELYEHIRFFNSYTYNDNKINFIDTKYKALLKNNALYLYIPEKLPNLKNTSSYVSKQIILNISTICKKYEKLFYDKFVIVVIQIHDKRKIWDVDNRTVKPIQDGLVHAGVIKDDNLFNCCYMVQGFYSDTPYVEVFILEADNILKNINKKLPKFSK